MNGPEQLARPLARRIAALSAVPQSASGLNSPAETVAHDTAVNAAVDALARGETHYTDRAGIMPLRTLVSERLAERTGVRVDPKAVTITCGLIEARSVAIRVLAKSGTGSDAADILCPQMLPDVVALAELIGARVMSLATAPFGLAYLTPADPPDQIAAALNSTAYIIWDMSIPGAAPHPAQQTALAPRITTVNGLDSVLPGWRVGWIAGSDMADRLRGFKQALTICTTSISQWAAAAWLKSN